MLFNDLTGYSRQDRIGQWVTTRPARSLV